MNNNKNNLTTRELLHILTDIMFACREKWGDEIFINYSGHVDTVDIDIHSGKWNTNKNSLVKITFSEFMDYEQAIDDLDNYYEHGLNYFVENDKYYWSKSPDFLEEYGGHDD